MTERGTERELMPEEPQVIEEVIPQLDPYERLATELHLTLGRLRKGGQRFSYANTPHGRRRVYLAEAELASERTIISYKTRAMIKRRSHYSVVIPNSYIKGYLDALNLTNNPKFQYGREYGIEDVPCLVIPDTEPKEVDRVPVEIPNDLHSLYAPTHWTI